MFILQPVHTIILLAAVLLIGKCYTYSMIRQRQGAQQEECQGCGDECNKCMYGVAVSYLCGTNECRKGPGERCGGPNQVFGVCGEGMSCTCGRCTGCSVDVLTCYDNVCLPHQTWRSHEINNGVYFDIYGNIRPPDGQKERRLDERRIRGLNIGRK